MQPDLLVLKTGGHGALRDSGIIDGPPDIVIEVLSPSTRLRDETLKRKLYQRAGVSEYWLVDPEVGEVRVLRAESGGFREVGCYTRGQTIRSPLLPGLRLAVDEIW